MFSNGAELAWVVPPQLLEVARTAEVASLPHLLDALGAGRVRAGRGRAERATAGGTRASAPRSTRRRGRAPGTGGARGACVVVTDVARLGRRARRRAQRPRRRVRRHRCVARARTGPAPAGDQLRRRRGPARRRRRRGPIDAVVVALARRRAGAGVADAPGWQRVLDEHAGITDRIGTDAAWVRAVVRSRGGDRAARPGGHRRRRHHRRRTEPGPGGGAALPRRPRRHRRPGRRVRDQRGGRAGLGAAAAAVRGRRLPGGAADAGALSGAELVADADWIGLRSHPQPGRDDLVRRARPSPAGSTARSGPWSPAARTRASRARGGTMAAPIERIVDAHIHLWDPGPRRLVPVPGRPAGAGHG